MGRGFKETAHLNTDLDKYGENYDAIFGKKSEDKVVTMAEASPLLHIHHAVESGYVDCELRLAMKSALEAGTLSKEDIDRVLDIFVVALEELERRS